MKIRFNLRKLLKNRLFISCSVLLIITAIVLTSVYLIPEKQLPVAENTPESSQTSNGVNVNVPTSISNNISSGTAEPTTTPSDIVIDVGGNTSTNKDSNNQTPAKQGEKPVTKSSPSQSKPSGIVIGGKTSESKYDCHTPNHHCANAENHAYITNLELEGCPLCGSHSCPSFYALDEWGYTTYNIRKCPKYNVYKDPVYYCQDCEKKTGDGSNGTCVQFLHACNCPNCGEYVEANTCHTCKE